MKSTYAQGVQIVWFPARQISFGAEVVFRKVFHKDPDNTSTNKVPSPGTPYLSRAVSNVDGLEKAVVIEPGRISVVIQPTDHLMTDEMPEFAIPLAKSSIIWAELSTIVERLDEEVLVPSVRAAIVLNTTWPTKSLGESNAIFTRMTGVASGENTQDLLFQKNDAYVIDGLTINRFENFAVQVFDLVKKQHAWQNGYSSPILTDEVMNNVFVISNLDYNTVPTGDVHDYKKLKEQYTTILHLIRERLNVEG